MLRTEKKVFDFVFFSFLSIVIVSGGIYGIITQKGSTLKGGQGGVGPENVPVSVFMVICGVFIFVKAFWELVKLRRRQNGTDAKSKE